MDIREISSEQLLEFLKHNNEKPFRAKQLHDWLWKKNVISFKEMINIPKNLQEKLKKNFSFLQAKIEKEVVSSDKTIKLLFRLFDDEQIEGVLIPSQGRITACVSSQVGCALKCSFCATGMLGFTRQLRFWEIIDQYVLMNRRAIETFGTPISNIVFMGMGEPLLNYDNLLKAIEILTSPEGNGLSPSRITVSTVGITIGIRKLADDGFKANLAVSLHVADNDKRSQLIPVNQTNSLQELQDALRYYVEKTKQRITIEYVLLQNRNDSLEDAEKLCRFCKAFPVKINIIEYNSTDSQFQPSTSEKKAAFTTHLESKNLIVNVRQSRGKDIAAACGQLAGKGKIMLLLCLFFTFFSPAFAQFYNGSHLTFGKSRVQFQNFNWQYYRNTQFDVYFYPNSRPIADYVNVVAPEIIKEIEQYFNFTSVKKLQFIVYRTQSDFKESNFNYDNDDFYNQAGITNIYGSKVYLFFDGNHAHLNKMIRGGIASVYARGIVQGQTVRANMASEYSSDAPNWFYSGLSSYIAENWNSELDAQMRDGIASKRYRRLDFLSPMDATIAGHSFWRYIVERYGEDAIPKILHACRSARSVERGFAFATGTRFKDLVKGWYRFYVVTFAKDKNRERPDTEPLVKRPRRTRHYSELTLSPDGESYAYTTNDAGQIRVWLKTPEDKRPKTVFRKNAKTEDKPDVTFPKLAWHPDGEIMGFTTEDKGRTKGIKTVQSYYHPVIVKTKKRQPRVLVELDKITDWNYLPGGNTLLLSGVKSGQTDIYLYHIQALGLEKITNDIYNDLYPRLMNDGKSIVFSSNRPVDSLTNRRFYNKESLNYFDLFVYNRSKSDNQLLRVTETPNASETHPLILETGEILYLSDENGINNRYVAKLDSAITKIDTAVHYAHFAKTAPLTDYVYSIFEHDYQQESNMLGEVLFHKGTTQLYEFPFEEMKPLPPLTPSSMKQKTLATKAIKDSIRVNNPIEFTKEGKKRGLRQMYRSDLIPIFNTVEVDSITPRNNVRGWQPNALSDGFEYRQPVARNYNVQFSVNRMVTQADFSFLNTSYQQFTGGTSPIYLNTGINALIMVGINDLFEDYRITGGFRVSFDLSGTEVMLSYENLKRRLDHQVVLYRQAIQQFVGWGVVKQHSNSVFYIMKYPFNRHNTMHFTFTGRYENFIIGALDDRTLRTPNENKLWGGVKVSYIYDSSKELFTNLWRGEKIKLWAEFNQCLATYQEKLEYGRVNLLVLGFDARKSVRVYKNMTWATRLAGSTNFGTARLVHYMGGVDNWIWAQFNRDNWTDLSKNYVYQTLATNMRGFEQNVRNGTSFLLLNSELRVPFVQLIAGRMLSSNILNSLQFLVFGEIGTAWTGLTPYSPDNSLYTRWIESGNILVRINRQVDPWVQGFGMGMRASLFGYFLRLDYAWGLENMQIYRKNGMLMFSLGLDF
jgi:23S rRNA (adenine(2503)-C(2))-methyltransferase